MKSIQEVIKVLNSFEEHNINYIVIRNYDFLSGEFPGKDIDIAIKPEDVKKINKVLYENQFVKQKICPFSHHLGFYKFINSDNKLLKFHFHVGGIAGSSSIYVPINKLLKNKKKFKGFNVISDEDLLVSLVFHSKIGLKGKKKYVNLVKKILSQDFDKNYVRRLFEESLGKTLTQKSLTLLYAHNFEELDLLKSKIRRKFLRRNFAEHLKINILGGFWKIKEVFKGAPVISFIGMDGAGKTTLTNQLVEIFENNKIRIKRIYTGRGRNNLLPIQKVGKPYKNFEKKVKIGEKSIKAIYTFASFFFFLDLLFRYFFVIYPAKLKNQLVITDRYGSDVLLMKNTPEFLRNIYYLFLPKPDLTFYIYNTVETLHKRKNHPLDDLKRQEKIFEGVLKKMNPVLVKNNSLIHSKNQIIYEIFERFRF